MSVAFLMFVLGPDLMFSFVFALVVCCFRSFVLAINEIRAYFSYFLYGIFAIFFWGTLSISPCLVMRVNVLVLEMNIEKLSHDSC